MLSKRRCPHTGVINFFNSADPHLAVGSVVKSDQSGYVWRCYGGSREAAGSVADMKTAEHRLIEYCRRVEARHGNPLLVDAA